MVAGPRPVIAQSQRLAPGEAGRKRWHPADPAFADDHHAIPDIPLVVARRSAEALDGNHLDGRIQRPFPRAFLADGMAFLTNQPADGKRDRTDRRRAESQRRKQVARVETEIDVQGQNPAQHGERKHEQWRIATRRDSHDRSVIGSRGGTQARDTYAMKCGQVAMAATGVLSSSHGLAHLTIRPNPSLRTRRGKPGGKPWIHGNFPTPMPYACRCFFVACLH